ncbi:CD1845 family protein [Fannyhessea vaginae]|uniref:CD1845 family protein n=1 Tax=Fannyhessea vaginae TaxID=82135 RepID=UPI00336A4C60
MNQARRMARVNTEHHPWIDMTDEEMLRSYRLILEDPETNKEGTHLRQSYFLVRITVSCPCYLSIRQTLFSECSMLIVMMFCIFGALPSCIQGEVGIGISGLAIGFLFSPYGLPMIGVTVIAFIELRNYKIKAV